ncbi:MAG: tRNA (N(6)-L-threonylcarbamoyladenosine(37)-C(2))-methylthiotransferase [Candidatus ainarchaeum sp.]|nr:tRNA (N(6)-L-threonylcarbamoyladenosine(37)-C(2))-methylthiotransferase [Candidatus ainarchaeum sp.]
MPEKFFLEGYGCSLNRAETEQAAGHLEASGLKQVSRPEEAAIILVNTCAVKEQTETRMISRIKALFAIAEKTNARLIVFGCLPKINSEKISEISKKIIQAGPDLKELSKKLGIKEISFSPEAPQKKSSKFVSIIPIARGCLGNCSFCATKNARGKLESHSIEQIRKKFFAETKKPCEVWLTAQDCGCYGFDIGTSLPCLLKKLLESKNDFRIRIGMMNPQNALRIADKLLPLFRDKRLYRFFHIPLQSGSDKILKKMNRPYSKKQFFLLIKKIRKTIPDAMISTDIIAGFPGETEKNFAETVKAVKLLKADIVNVSRFGSRPGTAAEKMPLQLHGRHKKNRSRILSELQKKISLQKNLSLLGTVQEIFVSEKGKKGNFVGRPVSYRPVVIEKNFLGKTLKIRVSNVFPHFVFGKITKD